MLGKTRRDRIQKTTMRKILKLDKIQDEIEDIHIQRAHMNYEPV